MKRSLCLLSLAVSLALVACSDTRSGVDITGPLDRRDGDNRGGNIKVMTQNLYVGTDVDAVIGALISPDPSDDFPALMQAIQTFQETDYATRLGAVADAIAKQQPHAVGLQEVSEVDIDLTALGVPVAIHADFLATLQAALAARGLHYAIAASVRNIEATPVPGVRLVDYDVLLVDADRVTLASSGGQNFAINLGVVAPGVELKRGWVWAKATVGHRDYFIVSTHLEGSARNHPELMEAQARELSLNVPSDRPVVVMGDFNDRPGSLMHQTMLAVGFNDVWESLGHGAGHTCCHSANLSDERSDFSDRIDYVFARGENKTGDVHGNIRLVGDEVSDKLTGPAYPIWASDHAGIVAHLGINSER